MGTWSMRVILVCGVAAVGCGGKSGATDTAVTPVDVGDSATGDHTTSGEPETKAEEVTPEERAPDCLLRSGEPAQCGGGADGAACGTCPENFVCHDGVCECVPQCSGKESGPDGCGDECGDDRAPPVPQCEGKECGPDSAGGSCGECTGGAEVCSQGKCVSPPDCSQAGAGECQRFMESAFSFEANAEGGLDLDDDPDTCAPEGECSDGVDNGFAAVLPELLSFFPEADAYLEALYGTEVFLQLSADNWDLGGGTFDLVGMYARPDASAGPCEWEAGGCASCALPDDVNSWDCSTPMTFESALVLDGVLTAGGPESLFSLQVPLGQDVALTVTFNMASIQAKVVPLDGGGFRLEDGLIGGAVRKDELMEAVDYMPEDLLSGEEKTVMKEALDTLAIPDIDTDDDGEKDAISFAFHFSTLPGTSVGLCPEW